MWRSCLVTPRARALVTAIKKGIKKQAVAQGFLFEDGSASFRINNAEPGGLVHVKHESGHFEVSWGGSHLRAPCGGVGRKLALASDTSLVALPCW